MIHVSANRGRDLRATLNLHRSNLIVAPAHGLQRGVVIVYLPLASHEVLLLKQHHLGLLVVLCARDARKDKFSLSHETKTGLYCVSNDDAHILYCKLQHDLCAETKSFCWILLYTRGGSNVVIIERKTFEQRVQRKTPGQKKAEF